MGRAGKSIRVDLRAASAYSRRMDTVLSIVVLAAVALIGGAIYLWRRGGANKQAALMLVLAVVMIANVLIWTLPDAGGTAPIERAASGPED